MSRATRNPFGNKQVKPLEIDELDDANYIYDDTHSRGAQILNEYEAQQNGLEYDYRKNTGELPLWNRIFRKGLYVIQLLLVVGGAIAVGGAIVAERSGIFFTRKKGKYHGGALPFGQMERELIYTPFATGAMSAFTAFVGCIGAKTRHKCGKCIFTFYLVCIVATLGLALASTSQAWADKSNVTKYALRQWRKMTGVQTRIFEWDFRCCNFKNLAPCCRFTPGEGECMNENVCYDMVEAHLIKNFDLIFTTSCIQTIFAFIITVASCVLCQIIECKARIKKKMFDKVENDNNVETDM